MPNVYSQKMTVILVLAGFSLGLHAAEEPEEEPERATRLDDELWLRPTEAVERFLQAMDDALQAIGDAPPCELPALDTKELSWDQFDAKHRGSPVVLRGLTNDWLDPSRWSERAFLDKYGSFTVDSVTKRYDNQLSADFQHPISQKMGVEEFLLWARNRSDSRMATADYTDLEHEITRKQGKLPELLQDFDQKPFVELGILGSGSQFHSSAESWHALLAGRKAWWIIENISAEAEDEMFTHTSHPCSWLDKAPPGAKKAKFCVQQPGEVIYLGDEQIRATCSLDDFVLVTGFQGRFPGKTEFDHVMTSGDAGALQQLVERESKEYLTSLHTPVNGTPYTPITYVAARNLTEMAKYIIGVVNSTAPAHEEEMTPMHSASFAGHLDMVRFLVDSKAAVNPVFNATEETPLHMAIRSGSTQLVEYLLEQKADFDAADGRGNTAVHVVAAYGHLPIAHLLKSAGAKLLVRSKEDNVGAMHLAAQHGHADFIQYLVTKRALVKSKEWKGNMPLHMAVHFGHARATRALLELGAPADAANKDRMTPFHFAAQTGRSDIFHLLSAKYDPSENKSENEGKSTTASGETAADETHTVEL